MRNGVEQSIEAAVGGYTITAEDAQDPESMFAMLQDAFPGEALGFEVEDLAKWLAEQAPDREPCSICGAPTEFALGTTQADWCLCGACEGSPEAEAAGYVH